MQCLSSKMTVPSGNSLLPPNTYALMVHKIFAQRIEGFLYSRSPVWNSEAAASEKDAPTAATAQNEEPRLLDTPYVRGPRFGRRGYVLLYLPRLKRPLGELPPTARQQISWAALLTHHCRYATAFPVQEFWEGLGLSKTRLPTVLLRLDVHPPDRTLAVCRALQQHAQPSKEDEEDSNDIDDVDPFAVGPINFTKSASKCTHRLTVIFLEEEEEGEETELFWGMCTTTSLPAFNSDAARQIVWSKINDGTKQDVEPNVPIATPVSKAYYKLLQVWEEHLSKHAALVHNLVGTTAIDVGACPGGWSQVLIHVMKMDRVLLIDPGLPAERVQKLPQLTHIPSKGESAALPCSGDNGNPLVVSILVCDVSVIWLESLQENIATLARKIPRWTLPAAWVITCKLPHKHAGSVRLHVDKMQREIVPALLQTSVPCMYPNEQHQEVKARFAVLHLLANSDSERTLLVYFEPKESSCLGDHPEEV